MVAASTSGNDWGIAWFGLAAVFLGAVIGGGSNFLIAWRKERADAKAGRQRHEVEVRRAARLIDDDIETAAAAGRQAIERKEWWFQGQELTSLGWQQYRDVLAPELSEIAWRSVRIAVMAIGHLQSQRDGAAKIHRAKMTVDPDSKDMVASAIALGLEIVFEPAPMSDTTVAQIETLLEGLEFGRAALARLIQDKS